MKNMELGAGMNYDYQSWVSWNSETEFMVRLKWVNMEIPLLSFLLP